MSVGIFRRELWSRSLFSWYLYDFANSFLVINATLYFSQWVVVDNKFSDFWFSLPFMTATAVLVFLSPYVGELGDRRGIHRAILVAATLAATAAGFLMFLSGRLIPSAIASVSAALFSYGLLLFFLQLALVPYNAFLKHLAPAAHYGKSSGLGLTFNQLGYIAGILLTLPIVNGTLILFGQDRLAPLIPATAAFFLFALPSFFVLRSPPAREESNVRLPFWRTFWVNLKEARNHPGVLPLLISFYLFSNGIASLTLFSAIYLEKVFAVSDAFKANVFLSVIVAYAAGALLGGIASDRLGHRRLLSFSLMGTSAAIIPIALLREASLTLILFPLFGLGIGMVYASSRAYFASLIPVAESGKFFGLYTFAERFGSVVGPGIWGLTTWTLVGSFPWNYRAAALAMAALVALGIVPLLRGRHTPTITVDCS